ncbi:MAG: carboxymuconolactone decarboxylase family protein [Acidiferrobacter sp.]
MTLVATQNPDIATGPVADTYAEIAKLFGRVPNALQIYSSSPALLAQQWDTVRYYRNHPTLSAALLATVRMLVSQANDCEYCVGFNEALLINACGQTPEQVAATKAQPEAAPLPPKDKAMLLLVLKAMAAPHTVVARDLDNLRALGWTDGDMLDAVAHGARNTAVDILFNTFQVERDF